MNPNEDSSSEARGRDPRAAEPSRPVVSGRARERTCIGCGEPLVGEAPSAPSIRLVLGPDGAIAVDGGRGGFGRGAHVHATPTCLASAVVKGLPRAAKRHDLTIHIATEAAASESAPLTVASLGEAIRQTMDRRMVGLLSSAVRKRALALGADAVSEACRRGDASLLVVACDAAAAAERTEVRHAIAEGNAIAWNTKDGLGEVCAKGAALAVAAVTSPEIAFAMRETAAILDACLGAQSARVGRNARREADRKGRDRRTNGGAVGSLGQSGANG